MNLVINSQFRPFTYDEMVKPLVQYKEVYDKIEQDYSNLTFQTELWKDIVNQTNSPEAYKMYNRYANDLAAITEDFSKGMNLNNRRALLGMKRRYAQDIEPISRAYKRREELSAEQRKTRAADPTLRYQRMANQISLDDFINNPSLDYGESYSGALLTKQVSQAASNLQKAMTDKSKLSKLGLPFQYERMLQYGATPSQVFSAMAEKAEDEPETATFLRGIVDQVMQSSGVEDWADQSTLDEFRAFANQGLYSAIGQAKLENFTDQAGLAQFRADLEDRNAQRAETRRAIREGAKADEDLIRNIKLSGVSYLHGTGDFGKYERILSGLKGGKNGVKASIFGKHGTVNPVAVYDQVQIAMNNAEKSIKSKYAPKLKQARTNAGRYGYSDASYYEEENKLLNAMNAEISSAKKQASRDILNRYGVSEILTEDQYDTLKAIGYNNSKTTEYSQLLDSLNALAKQRSYYSTNMSGYDIPDQKIRSQLGNWETNDSFSNRVYKLNADGTQGESVSYEDLKLYNDSNNEGRRITGVYYSAFTPGKIIVQVGESGDRYLMDPNILGSEVASLIRETNKFIKSDPDVDLTEASVATTTALSKLLNSYNPTASKSSADAGK